MARSKLLLMVIVLELAVLAGMALARWLDANARGNNELIRTLAAQGEPWIFRQTDMVLLGDSLFALANWPALLPQYKLANRGVPGETIREIGARLGPALELRPRYLVLLMGTNNINLGDSLATMQAQYEAVLNRVLAAHQPVVLTLVPGTVNDSAQHAAFNNNAQMFNRYLQSLCQKHQLTCLELEPAQADLSAWRTSDGLHPNAAGYVQWAQRIAQWLQALEATTHTNLPSTT